MTRQITKRDLLYCLNRLLKEVEDNGFTQLQLAQAAGLKRDSFSKMKNPTINTLVKLIDAKNELIKKKGN